MNPEQPAIPGPEAPQSRVARPRIRFYGSDSVRTLAAAALGAASLALGSCGIFGSSVTRDATLTSYDAGTVLTIEFPRTASDEIEGVTTMEIDEGFAPSTNSKPLAGSHVLVVASRREVRVQIRDALRNMGLIIDFVNSVDEASEFCREGLPHAIIIESIQRGEKFAHLRGEICAEVPDFVFIEIIEEGNTFEMSGFSGSNVARVGRDVIDSSLPSALMFELSKGL